MRDGISGIVGMGQYFQQKGFGLFDQALYLKGVSLLPFKFPPKPIGSSLLPDYN